MQLVIVNLYTKYELTVLYSCGDIFDEKYEEKEKRTNTGKNKQEKAYSQSHGTTCHCQHAWRERKVNIYRQEQTGEGWFSISLYNLSLSTFIQNMNFLCYTVVEISDEKYGEKEKKNKYKEELIGEGSFSIPMYNLPLLTCLPNMKFLSRMV